MLAVSQREIVSQSVPDPAPPANAPVVETTKYEPSGEKSTSRTKASNARAQELRDRSKRLVDHGASVAVAPLVSSTATCARGWPPTVAKLPTAARREPSAVTSKRLTLVEPPPLLPGS